MVLVTNINQNTANSFQHTVVKLYFPLLCIQLFTKLILWMKTYQSVYFYIQKYITVKNETVTAISRGLNNTH